MLQDGTRIQIDLHAALNVDKILLGATPLKYERDSGAVFVDFPETLRAGRVYCIDCYYSGNPLEAGGFGGVTFKKDPAGHSWINTACEGTGASLWRPDKDQWRDEVENMRISVAIPNDLVDVSNGKFLGKTDLGDARGALGPCVQRSQSCERALVFATCGEFPGRREDCTERRRRPALILSAAR